ncbi:MAG: hypothetical protein Q7T36_12705 [Fluviicoccus sp.]|uniref:hypothetical protein n=1 Tax=Fluviicoccus sp. TaxID=2003552 RepID=UPI002715935E|nr:hypothetical protein [Fluviicoccus sp.]MDO8331321.1 hypothetical protein [Fluviicoccus sp.]
MSRWQGGQSLPLMMVFIIALSSGAFYLFNTGMLLIERIKITSSADHVAYAVAIQQARLLNLNAYLNRAAIANQLAVAQNISVASWGMFVQPIPQRASPLLIPPMTPVGAPIVQISNMVALGMRPIAESMGAFILQNQLANVSIKEHQRLLNTLYYPVLLKDTPATILGASGLGREGVKFNYVVTSDNFASFVDRYADAERMRLQSVMMDSRDPFTAARKRWDEGFGLAKCSKWTPNMPYFEMIKRGGTQLLGLDEWKGMDTFSLHTYTGYWKSRKLRLPKWVCAHTEYPVGYGSSVTSKNGGNADSRDVASFDGSWSANPAGSSASSGSSPLWDSRRGSRAMAPAVPEFYDLSAEILKKQEPVLNVVIRLYKAKRELLTTAGRSAVKVGGGLQQFEKMPNNRMEASSRAVVYFDRPQSHHRNGISREKASLFNPYWRVRLESLREVDRAALSVP